MSQAPVSSSRTPKPIPGPARDYHFPRAERATLSNGLRLVTVNLPRLPLVTVLAVIDAGAATDPIPRAGLAAIVAKLMAEGSDGLTGIELSDALEHLGATLDSAADWDAAIHSLTVTSRNLEKAFELFAGILTQPAFPERELERLKAERLAELLQLRAEPRGLADEMFATAAYASTTRYALPEAGDRTTVAALTRDEVQQFYRLRYGPATTTLIVVGDVSSADASGLARRFLGNWTTTAEASTALVVKSARDHRAIHLVDKTDAPQSELRIGHVGIPRLHPDYFNVVVMNAILGGLFNSRINLNLREEHAYTYGAFSAFDWRRSAGPFVVSAAVKTEATAQSIAEVFRELDRIRSQPVASTELSLAISYLDGVFPIRFETTSAIAGALANQVIYRLPDDYFDTYRSNIRSVTSDRVMNAAVAHLRPGTMQVVVVGNSDAVRPQLEALGFGDVLASQP